jgi:hypothetical protein
MKRGRSKAPYVHSQIFNLANPTIPAGLETNKPKCTLP